MSGSEAFEGVALDKGVVPSMPQLWILLSPLMVPPGRHAELGLEEGEDLSAILMWPMPITGEPERRLCFTYLFWRGVDLAGNRIALFNPSQLPSIRMIAKARVGEALEGHTALVVAALSFMQLPFVSEEAAKQSRPMRRAYERKHGICPDVRIVTLRRAHHEAPGDEPSNVEWSCQWMVKGHWRKRAKKWGEGPPSYVTPHVKGPADKPFRAPRETVYKVRR